MTVGIVTQRFITGDGQGHINYAVAHAALDRGHTLVLIGSEVAPDLLEHPNVTWLRVDPSGWPSQLLRDQVFAWKSWRRIRNHRSSLDVLMANGAITWSPADVNAVHFVHDAWRQSAVRKRDTRSLLHSWYHSLYTHLNAAWERWALRQSRHVVAVSTKVKHQVEALGLDVPVHVIQNGVDPDVFSPDGPSVDRSSFGCPNDVPLGIFVGDIRRSVKNLDTVLQALQKIPALHLAVVGGTDGSPFPALAAKLDVADRVHFLGYRRDVPALMRTADLFLFPSRYDPFSLVLLEAMASGLPVITARTVGAAELVTPACGVVLENPNDPNALVDATRQLTTDPERRKIMGRAARNIALQYDIRRTGDQYVDLFETLQNERPLPSARRERSSNLASLSSSEPA